MPRPLRAFDPGGLYHLTSRAVADEPLYLFRQDRITFIGLVDEIRTSHRWECLSYCLMTNHYHLLVRIEEPNVSHGMQRLNGEYGRIFNSRHGMRGHRFFRRFDSAAIENDGHLQEVMRYIVLNPIRAGIVDDPALWPWSSYAATVGLTPAPKFFAKDELLAFFDERPHVAVRQFRQFVADAMLA